MLDILITNGQVVDGTGSAGYYAAVGVQGDTVSIHRGDASQIEAARTIDATGNVVCPGFIDLHSHAGLTILGAPHHDPKVRQGVTTELVGIDGISHAPFKTQDELHRYIWLDSGLNGYPPMPADWLSVADYLGNFDNTVAINVAYILGNSPVRIWSVGWNDRPPTDAEMADMKAVTREAMEEGAWGLSTGLDYPPGAYASTDELVALSETAEGLGGFYHTHTRASLRAQGLLAPWEEAIEIGRRSGIPIHLTHYRPERAGRRQSPRLSRPCRRRSRRGHGRHIRLLHLPIFRHDHHHWPSSLGEGRRSRTAYSSPARTRMNASEWRAKSHLKGCRTTG